MTSSWSALHTGCISNQTQTTMGSCRHTPHNPASGLSRDYRDYKLGPTTYSAQLPRLVQGMTSRHQLMRSSSHPLSLRRQSHSKHGNTGTLRFRMLQFLPQYKSREVAPVDLSRLAVLAGLLHLAVPAGLLHLAVPAGLLHLAVPAGPISPRGPCGPISPCDPCSP